MSLFLSVDETHRVVLVQMDGTVNDEVSCKHYQKMQEWMTIHGYFSVIVDFTRVVSLNVTARGVEKLAASTPLVTDSFLRVIVAPQDEAFGLARMFEMLGSQTRNKVHVVRTMAEAFRLFGVESLDLQPVGEW